MGYGRYFDALETLDHSGIRQHRPVFDGDTIYAESTAVAKEELLAMRRKIVVPKRPEGAPPWPS